jgi:small-conductance mechanosensitive channel
MNSYNFFILLSLIASFPYFLLKNKKKEYVRTHRLIFVLLFMVLILEIIGEITSRYAYNNSLYYNLLFVYLESCMIFYFFHLIHEEKKIKKTITYALVFYVVLGIIVSIFFQPIHLEFHNYSYAFGSIVIIILAIKFFMDVFNLKRYGDKNLLSIPYFWIITVILFFYSATFFYFTPLRLLYDIDKSLIEPLSIIIQFLAGLMYIVFGLSFYAPYLFRERYEA